MPTRADLHVDGLTAAYVALASVADRLAVPLEHLPYTVKVLLENVLRHSGTAPFGPRDVEIVAGWEPGVSHRPEFPFMPARVLLQDFTGVPVVVDLAAMRSAVEAMGGDARRVNPVVPADLVIDHSVQVDAFGTAAAFRLNVEQEYVRNRERYLLLRWAQRSFDNLRVVPPGTGIVHQVNLEFLAPVVAARPSGEGTVAFPDTLVGTDSHTTMINGLGVLGWGVGGIEAEAVMLGQPLYLTLPEVIGFRLTGDLADGVTATDLVLTVTEILRKVGVVNKFVEFFGDSLKYLSLPDRATIANMSPEYGATAALFPIDDETVAYLRLTGRARRQVELVEAYARAQGWFRTAGASEPVYDQVVTLDLSTVEPSVAGPRRPQDRVPLTGVRTSFETFSSQLASLREGRDARGDGATAVAERPPRVMVEVHGRRAELTDGSVVIAAITSCTNTSNPAVMLAAGLLARKAVERGLAVSPAVKTSLAPGSAVVTAYLAQAGLTPFLEQLGFHLVGYGCTTCIGNSGPLPEPVAGAVAEGDLVVAAVLSGNRNFEGRIHPQVRASYLASPPLVVAYALAGTVKTDLSRDPIGVGTLGVPVYLRDIWPTDAEIKALMAEAVSPEMFTARYRDVFTGDETWQTLPVPDSEVYAWETESTYIQEPPFFAGLPVTPPDPTDIRGARVLAWVGDSVTTDHISPAGAIHKDSPAGQYLIGHGVPPAGFNTYGARRGNHEVMMRGTFANPRLRNRLAGGREGGWTEYFPTGEMLSIYDAAMRYQAEGTPLLVFAGAEYGSGSSRDWAAKGPALLGVRAVIAESFERIHRSNLVGMGILPLQFQQGENGETLGFSGRERFDIEGVEAGVHPKMTITVRARVDDGSSVTFQTTARLDTPVDVEYYRHGGILPYVVRQLAR
ncbi:MAG TPA: aconitate hydratase AcnA [bacterium]|nr:aconitate hydratase AcnA [bacterium]